MECQSSGIGLRPVPRHLIGAHPEFVCRIARPATIGGRPGIVSIISARPWITGVTQYMLDAAIHGLRAIGLRGAWPRIREAI